MCYGSQYWTADNTKVYGCCCPTNTNGPLNTQTHTGQLNDHFPGLAGHTLVFFFSLSYQIYINIVYSPKTYRSWNRGRKQTASHMLVQLFVKYLQHLFWTCAFWQDISGMCRTSSDFVAQHCMQAEVICLHHYCWRGCRLCYLWAETTVVTMLKRPHSLTVIDQLIDGLTVLVWTLCRAQHCMLTTMPYSQRVIGRAFACCKTASKKQISWRLDNLDSVLSLSFTWLVRRKNTCYSL